MGAFECDSLESFLGTDICEGGCQLILLRVTCRGHSKITHKVPHSPWKKKKKSTNFLRNHSWRSLQETRDSSPAHSPLWNSKPTDQAEYGWACISVIFFTSCPLSGKSKVMASEHESPWNALPWNKHAREGAVESRKRFRKPGFKPYSCDFLLVSFCQSVSVVFISSVG